MEIQNTLGINQEWINFILCFHNDLDDLEENNRHDNSNIRYKNLNEYLFK